MRRYLLLAGCGLGLAACTDAGSRPEWRDGRPDIVHAAPGDEALDAATRSARAQLARFDRTLAVGTGGCAELALKVRIGPTRSGEQVWLVAPRKLAGGYRGVVGNEPRSVPDLRRGESITVPERGVTDWMMVCDGVLVGGESLRLALRRAWPWQRARWRDAAGFRIED